ncbi:ATP-binding protein [Kitasatospora sp. NPDC015120]|uniref:ATP-binding protein n=1 Tax=Kitasatospora sp. NPDC015120 TaxID=3364023 RepID=UPI0036F4AB46
MRPVLKIEVPLRDAAVGTARNELLHQVTELAGIRLDDDRRYALRVCASELIANGIQHGPDQADTALPLLVEGHLTGQRLRITVTDGGLAVPAMNGTNEDMSATGGRGLAVVDGYADDHGYHQRTDDTGAPVGFSVWFELDVLPPEAGVAFGEVGEQQAVLFPQHIVSRPTVVRAGSAARRRAVALRARFGGRDRLAA